MTAITYSGHFNTMIISFLKLDSQRINFPSVPFFMGSTLKIGFYSKD